MGTVEPAFHVLIMHVAGELLGRAKRGRMRHHVDVCSEDIARSTIACDRAILMLQEPIGLIVQV